MHRPCRCGVQCSVGLRKNQLRFPDLSVLRRLAEAGRLLFEALALALQHPPDIARHRLFQIPSEENRKVLRNLVWQMALVEPLYRTFIRHVGTS
jgi:hypothetical protein